MINKQNAFMGMLIAGIMAVIVGSVMLYVGFFASAVVASSMSSTLDPAASSGALTFSGNVSNGELINITYGTGVYRFEFNTTANGSAATCRTANCIIVNLSETSGTQAAPNPNVYNTSVKASGNLTSAINANTSVAALVTAVNTTNTTTITADSTGSAYNSIATTENAANAAWDAAALSGGRDGEASFTTARTNVNTAFILLGIVLIVGGAGSIIAVLVGFRG